MTDFRWSWEAADGRCFFCNGAGWRSLHHGPLTGWIACQCKDRPTRAEIQRRLDTALTKLDQSVASGQQGYERPWSIDEIEGFLDAEMRGQAYKRPAPKAPPSPMTEQDILDLMDGGA